MLDKYLSDTFNYHITNMCLDGSGLGTLDQDVKEDTRTVWSSLHQVGTVGGHKTRHASCGPVQRASEASNRGSCTQVPHSFLI